MRECVRHTKFHINTDKHAHNRETKEYIQLIKK